MNRNRPKWYRPLLRRLEANPRGRRREILVLQFLLAWDDLDRYMLLRELRRT